MEEKKEIKVSLGTAACMFIILILIVALVVMHFYYNNKLDSNSEKQISNNVELNINTTEKENFNNKELNTNTTEKESLENVNNNQDNEDYESIGKKLFEQYLQKQEELVNYEINSCKMISYYNNEFICEVNYDVKVEDNAEDSIWAAGNGIAEGNWIREKNVFLSFKKINETYTYNENVGQMTAWDISYFEN